MENLKIDVGALECWSKENHLPLNVKKCKIVTYSRRKNPIHANYTIQGELLQRAGEMKDLGVIMEEKLSYTKHFQKIENTAKKMIGLIRRFSHSFVFHIAFVVFIPSDYCTLL